MKRKMTTKGYKVVDSITVPSHELDTFEIPSWRKWRSGLMGDDFANNRVTFQKLVKCPRIFCNIKR